MVPVMQRSAPKEWNLLELRLAKAIDVGTLMEPDLDIDGIRLPLLKIFEYEHWQVKPEELELLKPSIQFASNLVRVGMPYVASFLPPRDEMFVDGEFLDRNGQRRNLCPTEIRIKGDPTKEEVAAALESLENLALSIKWQINNEMFAVSRKRQEGDSEALGWMGITRLIDDPRPWGPITDEMVVRADAKSRGLGLDHRPLIIGIMGEYVKAINTSPKNSEQRLRAIFMAGITMAHEVGHAIFHQDFRSYNPPSLQEPYVGNDCSRELGISFIKWIFGGYNPNPASLSGHRLTDYTAHLTWTECFDTGIDRRPLYKSFYSISMPWIEEKLTQNWWDSLPPPHQLIDFSSKAKQALKPITSSASIDIATARLPEWTYSWTTGDANWKNEFNFRKRGYRYGDKVEGLTEEEIAWVKANQPLSKLDARTASKSPEEQAESHRRARIMAADVEESEVVGWLTNRSEAEQDVFGIASALYDEVSETGIDDGVVERNLFLSKSGDEGPLTDIVVRYLAEGDFPTEDPMNEDLENYGFPPKQVKIDSGSSEAEKFLERSSAFTLAATMTRMEMHNMCIARKIPGYAKVEPTEAWQQSRPTLDDKFEDVRVLLALSNDMIEAALVHLFSDDVHAQIKLKEASLETVPHWDWPQIRRFCETNRVKYQDTVDIVRAHMAVAEFKRDEIEALRPDSEGLLSLPPRPSIAANNPLNWNLYELEEFCIDHDLPMTGTFTSLKFRVKRWQDQRNHGPRPRRTQLHRLDDNGFEVYTFRVHLGASTVSALKSALYIAGDFAPDAVLTLFFREKYYAPLHDDQSLLAYNTSRPDWSTLSLKVASRRQSRPGSTPSNAVEVDARRDVRFNTPISLPGRNAPSTIAPQFPVITYGSEPTPAEIIAAARSDPRTERSVAVTLRSASPTFSELLSSVGNRALRLDQMMLAGGRFQTRGGEDAGLVLSQSGMEILEEVEDYRDDEEVKKRRLEALIDFDVGKGGRKRKRDPLEGYPPLGTSHMVDLLYATSKKVKPAEGYDAEY